MNYFVRAALEWRRLASPSSAAPVMTKIRSLFSGVGVGGGGEISVPPQFFLESECLQPAGAGKKGMKPSEFPAGAGADGLCPRKGATNWFSRPGAPGRDPSGKWAAKATICPSGLMDIAVLRVSGDGSC